MHFAEAETRDGPTLFVGLAFVFNEIVAAQTEGNSKIHAMRAAMDARHEASMKQAAEEFAKLAAQNALLANTISSVIAKHQNRRPRV